MEEITLHIFDEKNQQICPAFIKANHYLLNEHRTLFESITSDIERICQLEQLWYLTFGGKLMKNEKSNTSWDYIEFDNSNAKTLFLLKWGS